MCFSAGTGVHLGDLGDEHADDVADIVEHRGGGVFRGGEDGNQGEERALEGETGEERALEGETGEELLEELEKQGEQHGGLRVVQREVQQRRQQQRQLRTQMARDLRQVEENLVRTDCREPTEMRSDSSQYT